MILLLRPLDEGQLKLLGLVAAVQQEFRAAPTWEYLQCEFDRAGLDAEQAFVSLPRVGKLDGRNYGPLWIDTNILMPATRVRLTIAGRHHLPDSEQQNTKAFVFLLKRLVATRLNVHMSPIEVLPVYITRPELSDQVHDPTGNLSTSLFAPGMIEQIKLLVDREPVLMAAVEPDPEDENGWRIRLRRELVLYKEAETIEQYIQCVTRILTPPPPAPVEPYPSPLGIAAAFDYLDVVWQLRFGKPLVTRINGEGTARLALPVDTQEDLRAQLSSIAQLLKGCRVPRQDGGHPAQSIVPYLERNCGLDDAAVNRVRDAVAILEAIVHIRNAQQHGGGQERGAQAIGTLGLTYPIINPSYAWQVIQYMLVVALTALREEIQGTLP